MEKQRNFQRIYAGRTNLSKQTDRPLMKLGFLQLPHYPIGVKRVHVNSPNVEGTALSNILKLQATFLYSIYHQQAGKTNLFHSRFHAGNTLCTFKLFISFRISVNYTEICPKSSPGRNGLSSRTLCLLTYLEHAFSPDIERPHKMNGVF